MCDLWKKAGCPSADYIIVDEAQDFSKEDIELFRSKARKALLLYGDSAQQLYTFIKDKQTVSMEDIQYFTKFPVEQLVFNHRLPKKIARFAQYLNSESDELEERCTCEVTARGACHVGEIQRPDKTYSLNTLRIYLPTVSLLFPILACGGTEVFCGLRACRLAHAVYAYYEDYNINADDAACAVATALEAEKLVFLTDIEGVFIDPTTRMNSKRFLTFFNTYWRV